MLGNMKFHPSYVEDGIYDFMDDYAVGTDTYKESLINVIADYLDKYTPQIEWGLSVTERLFDGGVCYVSWIENGHLHMIGFDYVKEDCL